MKPQFLTHHDDGKCKIQSHEVSLCKDHMVYNAASGIYSREFGDLVGYGSSKEEALAEFISKFEYLLNEWNAFGKMLLETPVIVDNIKEVDCFGKEIQE